MKLPLASRQGHSSKAFGVIAHSSRFTERAGEQ